MCDSSFSYCVTLVVVINVCVLSTAMLREYFGNYGEVVDMRIKIDPDDLRINPGEMSSSGIEQKNDIITVTLFTIIRPVLTCFLVRISLHNLVGGR